MSVFSFVLLALGLLLASAPSAGAATLHATTVATNDFWINESYAIGSDQSNCNTTTCCAQNNTSTAAYLSATAFDPFTLPVDQVITAVEVDVSCRSSAGTTGNQARIQVSGSVTTTLWDSAIWDQSASDVACRWLSGGTGWNITYLKTNWTQADIQSLNIAVRRVRGLQAQPLRVNAFRIKVTTVALPPVCSLSLGSVDFGQVGVGQTKFDSFTITNTGYGTLSGTVTSPCANFPVISGGGAYALTHGQVWSVGLRFAPTVTGPASCTIATGCGAGVAVQGVGVPVGACCLGGGAACEMKTSAACSGEYMGDGSTCAACPACAVSASSLNFGAVAAGSWKQLDFTLTNVGAGTLAGTVHWSGDVASFQLNGSSSYSLTAGQSRTFSIFFEPAEDNGQTYDAQLDMGCGRYVYLTGVGVHSACTLNRQIVDFGTVPIGQSADQTITLTNPGPGRVTGATYSGCGRFAIVPTTGIQLEVGQSAVYTIRFTPHDQDIPIDEVGFEIGAGQQTLTALTIGMGVDVSAVPPSPPAPDRYLLRAPEPNPAQGPVLIHYDVPETKTIRLEVFDVQGRRVRLLSDAVVSGGSHSLVWDRRSDSGSSAPGGVYFLRMSAPGITPLRQVIVLN